MIFKINRNRNRNNIIKSLTFLISLTTLISLNSIDGYASESSLSCAPLFLNFNKKLENDYSPLHSDKKFESNHYVEVSFDSTAVAIYPAKAKVWQVSGLDRINGEIPLLPGSPKSLPKKSRFLSFLGMGRAEVSQTEVLEPVAMNAKLEKIAEDEVKLSGSTISPENTIFDAKLPLFMNSVSEISLDKLVSNNASFYSFEEATGIRFRVRCKDCNVIYKIHYTTMKHLISRGSIQRVHYEAEFKPENKWSDIYIPFSQFKEVSTYSTRGFISEEEKNMDPKNSPWTPSISFQALKDPSSMEVASIATGSSSADLYIKGEIVFERDLMDPWILKELAYSSRNSSFIDYRYKENFDGAVESILLKKVFSNLYNQEMQEKVIEIARGGKDKIIQHLQMIGFSPVFIDKKIGIRGFFLPQISGNEASFFNDLRALGVPFETSEFAEDHSHWAHALQILAMTDNLNKEELTLFKNIYSSQFGKKASGWVFWETVFDAPGFSFPNSPRFWKKKLAQHGVVEGFN